MALSSRWVVLAVLISLFSFLFFPEASYANSKWMKYFRKDTLLNTYMRTYCVDGDRLWVGTYGDGIVIYDSRSTLNYNSKSTRTSPERDDGLVSDYVTSMAIDKKNGRVWIGTNAGLASCDLEGQEWQRFTTKEGLPNDVIRDVTIDNSGRLWAGTPSGVAMFDGDTWKIFNEENGLHQNSVHSITVEGDVVWVGTVGGSISQFKDGRWRLFLRH